MKKFALLLLACLFISFCSLFKSKAPPYPSGVVFPLKKAAEIVYEGKVIDRTENLAGKLYFATTKGCVYCLDGLKHQILWRFEVSGPLESPLFFSEGNIYVYDIQNTLYSLDSNGNLLWKKKVEEKITSGVGKFRGKTFLGMEKGIFLALDAASGEEIWRFKAGGAIRTIPVFAGDEIIFGCDDHNLYFLSEKGTLTGQIKVEGKIQSTPLVEKNSLYFGADDHYFYSFNLAKRNKKWRLKTGGKISTPAVIQGKKIYFLSWNNVLYCLNKRNGSILWWSTIPSRSFYRLEISGEKIVVSSLSSLLLCFDVKTGEKVGEYDAGQEVKSNPLWQAPYLIYNLYDDQTDKGRLVFLEKVIKVSLKSSMESPQSVGKEIVFTVSVVGFHKPEYEFYLREGEEERIGQERSEKKSWAWFPEKEGNFIVGVRVVDKKESREAEIPFVIKKKEKNI